MIILTIVGARPQFVKAAVVSREISKHKDVTEIIVHTGQHYDDNMSKVFFDEMDIPYPQYNLNINGLSHGAMTGQMLQGIENILLETKPDWVLVYGDTNSTLAGALAATKLHIKIAHVEAGLRSFNNLMPEEINRILTDRISDILFCPTQTAISNLENEGYNNLQKEIIKTGDVMKDAADYYIQKEYDFNLTIPEKFYLATIHREENTNNLHKLETIFQAFEKVSSDVKILIPIHPRTKAFLQNTDFNLANTNIIFIDPVGYLDMIHLIKNSLLIITDSGGLQKEAYFFEKNCVTLRDQTEWTELVSGGYNVLSNIDVQEIVSNVQIMSQKKFTKENTSLYGDGHSASVIVNHLIKFAK